MQLILHVISFVLGGCFFNKHTPLGGQLYLMAQVWVKINPSRVCFLVLSSVRLIIHLTLRFFHSKQELTLSKKSSLAYL